MSVCGMECVQFVEYRINDTWNYNIIGGLIRWNCCMSGKPGKLAKVLSGQTVRNCLVGWLFVIY